MTIYSTRYIIYKAPKNGLHNGAYFSFNYDIQRRPSIPITKSTTTPQQQPPPTNLHAHPNQLNQQNNNKSQSQQKSKVKKSQSMKISEIL